MEKVYKIISNINQTILNPIIFLLIAVGLAYFIYGVFEYFWKAKSDPVKVKDGAAHMLWGIVGMFIMLSVFGFFRFLLNTVPTSDRAKDNVDRVLDIN